MNDSSTPGVSGKTPGVDARAFLSGTTAFWLNAFFDIPQVRGGNDGPSAHPDWRAAAWEIREGKDPEKSVEWLKNESDVDDTVFLYIFTHGNWMRNVLRWNSWFPNEWKQLNVSKKILMIDTCFAEEFLEPIRNDPTPHISLGCCSADEVSWAGLEEEELQELKEILWSTEARSTLGVKILYNSKLHRLYAATKELGIHSSIIRPMLDEYGANCRGGAVDPKQNWLKQALLHLLTAKKG